MISTNRRAIFAAAGIVAIAAASVQASIIRASAGLGTVDTNAPTIGGSYEGVLGYRFTLDEIVQVEPVGGRLWGWGRGEIFAAIVPLSGPAGMPSIPFVETMLASVIFDAPLGPPAVDFRIPLSLRLNPGGYALIFGPRGVNAEAQVPENNPPLAESDSIIYTNRELDVWVTPTYDGVLPRFVIEGVVIPEPRIAVLAALAIGVLGVRTLRSRVA